MFTQLETGAGLDFVLWLQSMRSAPLDGLAQILDFLGGDLGMMLLVLAVYWSVDRHLGRRTLFLFIVAEIGVTVLKYIFGSPRPFMVAPDRVFQLFEQGTYGIPSGHVAISLAVVGYVVLSLNLRRVWWWGVGLFILLMAWSRMYAGAHYPQDVIIGALLGLALIGFARRFMETFASFWRSVRWEIKIVAIVIIGLVVGLVIYSGEDGQSVLGAIIFGGISLVIEERWILFAAPADWMRRLACLIGGLVLVGMAYYGLKALFGDMEPAAVFRVIRYGTVSAMAIAIFPWLCIRFGLMQKEKRQETAAA